MKKSSIAILFGTLLCSSYSQASAFGCDGYSSDADKLHIYSGPYSVGSSQNRYLPGTYKFKAKEALDGSWGSNLTWYLKKETSPGVYNQTLYEQDDYFDFFASDNQNINIPARGKYCAVIVSHGNCNNRCLVTQDKPTADNSHEPTPNGYAEYNSQFQFYGSGDIDDLAINNTLTYKWNFDDGTTSTQKNPTHYFSKAGTYNVHLTTNDGTFTSNIDSSVLWVRGPAQPPKNLRYEYGNCSSNSRRGFMEWERSGTSFTVQMKSGSNWQNVYTGSNTFTQYNTSSTGTKTIRIKASDPTYGSDSGWKNHTINVPSCGGEGGGQQPL